MIETRLRELLREKGSAFSMDPRMPPAILRRVRPRVGLRLVRVASLLTAAVLVSTLGVENARRPAGVDSQVDTVRLVTYINADDPSDGHHGASAKDDPQSLHQLRPVHADGGIQRSRPVRTEQGWTIPVTHRPDDTPDWREAAFVTCRPHDVHLTGDLILGGRTTAEIETFAACMRSAGYDLRAPVRDDDEHRFDLRGTGFDTDPDAFHRAAFVTCAPGS